ncbi:MAG: hypothetical protein KF849_15960 [Rhizobiaceae bacterium]|nr:hypothetical protein [Rhizobiaceae bacterium]
MSRPPAQMRLADDTIAYLYRASDLDAARRGEVAAELAASPMFSALVRGGLPAGSFLPVGQFPAGASGRPVLLTVEAARTMLTRRGAPSRDDLRHALAVIAAPLTATTASEGGMVLYGRSGGKLWRVALRGDSAGRHWLVGFQCKNETAARANLARRGIRLD